MTMTEKIQDVRKQMVNYIKSQKFDMTECSYLCKISTTTIHKIKINKPVKIEIVAAVYDYVKERENGK